MAPTLMYLVDNWQASTIRDFEDVNKDNSFKTFAFPVPKFDIENQPFIVVCGDKNLIIFNVKNGSSKALINKRMSLGVAGHQNAFVKEEKDGVSLHFAIRFLQKCQYSYFPMNQKLLDSLQKKEEGFDPQIRIRNDIA